MTYPRRVVVEKIISSRYPSAERPISWDQRGAGIDEVLTTSGERLGLLSSGGQSPPQPGWELLLTGESSGLGASGVCWTLFGITSGVARKPVQNVSVH